ncbi:U32 family peptidase [Chelatococcus sp. SYSU_G07232]|uniref:Ubiquinone biosynthesis protein UbiV n=1 Tax=Chelatococcus albus TaxID=3047466 RepID=A0ABT7AGT7_9HYPH|nr:U32 family peptidase [Chelatococcus sp. SYSU_G07232]MDJ1158212.1 U32 family peptidase [Chelatococcus sp. SYSU_G07232]
MQLTLGPVLFNWEAPVWRDFYFRIADEAPVDVVAVGEVVCSKRLPFFAEHLPVVVERLAQAGKTVLLSSLQLVTLERERRQTAGLAQSEDFLVEANDISCLHHLAGRPHAIGPFVNVYNEATAAFLASRGARRICLPPELPLSSIAAIAKGVPDVDVEVFAFGRAPLAISARCYHARLHKLTKDNCRFVCDRDPDGLPVETLDGEPFLAMNGVQTLAHACTNLLAEAVDLASAGVRALRLSPQRCDMAAVARLFRDVLEGRREAEPASADLARLYPGAPLANGFLHARPGAERVAMEEATAFVVQGMGRRAAPPAAG